MTEFLFIASLTQSYNLTLCLALGLSESLPEKTEAQSGEHLLADQRSVRLLSILSPNGRWLRDGGESLGEKSRPRSPIIRGIHSSLFCNKNAQPTVGLTSCSKVPKTV